MTKNDEELVEFDPYHGMSWGGRVAAKAMGYGCSTIAALILAGGLFSALWAIVGALRGDKGLQQGVLLFGGYLVLLAGLAGGAKLFARLDSRAQTTLQALALALGAAVGAFFLLDILMSDSTTRRAVLGLGAFYLFVFAFQKAEMALGGDAL